MLDTIYQYGATALGRDPLNDGSLSHRASNAELAIGVLILGLVGVIGILIFSSVEGAINVSGHELEGPLNDLTGYFGDAMSLVGIAMIVAVAALIIAYVSGMGGRDPGSGLR